MENLAKAILPFTAYPPVKTESNYNCSEDFLIAACILIKPNSNFICSRFFYIAISFNRRNSSALKGLSLK